MKAEDYKFSDDEIRALQYCRDSRNAKTVRDWLKEHPRPNLIFLPSYAPNLNLTERFWKFAKKKLVNNKYYPKYKIFRAKVFQFLNHTDEYLNELKTLMAEKFEIV